MDRAFRAAGVEVPSSARAWDPQRSYERRLLKIAAKSALFAKRTPARHDIDSGGELSEDDNDDDERRSPSPTAQKRDRQHSDGDEEHDDEDPKRRRV